MASTTASNRIVALAGSAGARKPKTIVDAYLGNLTSYRGTATATDDLTIMVVRRLEAVRSD